VEVIQCHGLKGSVIEFCRGLRAILLKLQSCHKSSFLEHEPNLQITPNMSMPTMTISPKFQVAIPKRIRQALNLVPGQRMGERLNDGRVEYFPEKTVASLRGRWPGLKFGSEREADRVCAFVNFKPAATRKLVSQT
jgi:AbrB family looped-hinge helix DNA binding protein